MALLSLLATGAFAHGVAENDKLFIEQSSGTQLIPYIYLGAKHKVTGYDPSAVPVWHDFLSVLDARSRNLRHAIRHRATPRIDVPLKASIPSNFATLIFPT